MAAREDNLRYTSDEIARIRNGQVIARPHARNSSVQGSVSRKTSNALFRKDRDAVALKVVVSVVVLAVLVFFSLCFTGATGQYYAYAQAYTFYTPADVAQALYLHAYNAIAEVTHRFDPYSHQWLAENCPGYWAIFERLGVVGVTLVCALLLSLSGMLYQNVFKNPIAGPGMLGATSGVSLGMMLLVALNGSAAVGMLHERYLYCYGLGAAILIFVLLAGKKLSGPGKPFDIVTMLLIGSIFSQLIGFVVSYVTLFVMSEEDYAVFYTLSQMLTVDTSALSWTTLGLASVASIVPVYLMRFRMNALAFDEQEAKLMGVNFTTMRAIALLCGAIMMLAAAIHTGSVGLVSLVVPFLARNWFGCEFSRQFTGCACISTVLLLACRDITDAIPFVGDGIAIGSVVSIVALPLFLVIVARGMRGWE